MRYKIKFLDFWHISSGISGGAILDNLVIKDENNLPFISGKTLKGLLREAAEVLGYDELVKRCFGNENNQGECYFSNAYLDEELQEEIISNNLQNELYKIITFTAIDDNGIARDDTLREIEFTIPLELFAEIKNIPDEYEQKFENILKMVKRMGLSRNRGFGRCQLKVVKWNLDIK